jgi:HSP20 family protein
MAIKDIIKKETNKSGLPARREWEHPYSSLQREVNRLFDSFFSGAGIEPFKTSEEWHGAFSPKLDVKESDKELHITAELPGMEEKDIEVSITRDSLTLKGEKKEEKEEKDKNYWYSERRYGSFHRVIPLSEGIDTRKADASFSKGVLKIVIPKTAKAAAKKIAVKTKQA